MIDPNEKIFKDSKLNMRDILAIIITNGILVQHGGSSNDIANSSYHIVDALISKSTEPYTRLKYAKSGEEYCEINLPIEIKKNSKMYKEIEKLCHETFDYEERRIIIDWLNTKTIKIDSDGISDIAEEKFIKKLNLVLMVD